MCYIYENLSGSLFKGTQLNDLNMTQCLLLILLKSSYQVTELTKNWKEALEIIQKILSPWKGPRGVRKQTEGGGQAYLYVRSVKKIAWFFKQQTDFFLISCLAVAESFSALSLVQQFLLLKGIFY